MPDLCLAALVAHCLLCIYLPIFARCSRIVPLYFVCFSFVPASADDAQSFCRHRVTASFASLKSLPVSDVELQAHLCGIMCFYYPPDT